MIDLSRTPPPEPLPDGLSDGEYLEFCNRHYSVAKIVEARARDDRNVWLLVLPEGRYWRQTFDAAAYEKDRNAKTLLSDLRSFCRCGEPYLPDTTMFHCPSSTCRIWNHEECLLDKIGKKAWKSYQDGKMDDFVEKNKPDTCQSLTNKLLSLVKAVAQLLPTRVEEVLEEGG